MKLKAGRLIVSHAWGEARARLRISTPEGDAVTPSNALFYIETDAGKTRVTCATGWVEFQPSAGAAVQIPPGSSGEWTSSESRMIAAETDARGQENLREAVETEEYLRAQLAQRSNLLPR